MTSKGHWWKHRTVIVSDNHTAAIENCPALTDAIVERVPWESVSALKSEVGLLIVEVHSPRECHRAFESWAGQGRQPITIVLIAAALGQAELRSRLVHWGFDRVYSGTADENLEALGDVISLIHSTDQWMASWFLQAIGSDEPNLVRAISGAFTRDGLPEGPMEWAQRTGLELWELERLFDDAGIPPPRSVLSRLRGWYAVALASLAPCPPTRDHLAKAVGFRGPRRGDYLGRRTKRLTGLSFHSLVRGDLRRAVQAIATSSRQ